MPRKSSIAKPKEVLQVLTRIIRDDDRARPGHVLRAAEMLGKYYGMDNSSTKDSPPPPQIIIKP